MDTNLWLQRLQRRIYLSEYQYSGLESFEEVQNVNYQEAGAFYGDVSAAGRLANHILVRRAHTPVYKF